MEYNFERGKFDESKLEKAVIELFKEQGYTYVKGEDMYRQYDEILLKDDLLSYLLERYKDACLTNVELETIVNKLSFIYSTTLYDGNKNAFFLVNKGFNLQREDKDKVALHVDFINYEEPEKNIFKVVNQYSVQGSQLRRPDLLIFVNGIPIVIWEFKSAIKEETTIYDAWEQITIRYCRDIPNLLTYCFFSVISDGANTKLGTIFSLYKHYYSWNKANNKDKVANGISSLLTMMHGVFTKERLCSILRDFIFYPNESKTDEAIICRYPQFFATNSIFKSIKAHLRPMGDGKGGTYFGATGCGKTHIMLFLARKLIKRDNSILDNPTIIIIEDREDLDTQTSKLFVNATSFLGDNDVRSIESRNDLKKHLKDKPSGGVYITTIQKFCEDIGQLSDRNNIICISDEAHRTQTGIRPKLKITDKGVQTTYGFAYYLRESFPNATYFGFSGTPIDDTFAVFGEMVDEHYTMKESVDDEITVPIVYEPRLIRVQISEEQTKKIDQYYNRCAEQGSTEEQIEDSKKAMSQMAVILNHPDRLKKLTQDIVTHYETICAQKPKVVQKAMIVCIDRSTAFKVLKGILELRPEWGEKHKAEDESVLSKEELNKLVALPKINLVATRGPNDPEDLYNTCGTDEYRKMLDVQFREDNSNFRIAIVVDMWITGFDVSSLAVMYIDKPIQRHTLIQTISRVNRLFEGKEQGLIVDYIGIKKNMQKALKVYGGGGGSLGDKGEEESPIDDLDMSLKIFRNQLSLLDAIFNGFDATDFYKGNPKEKLLCLGNAAEYVQQNKDTTTRFMKLSRILKSAYNICYPSGKLTQEEVDKALFYLAIRSIVYKQTKGEAPDTEKMNEVVEKMVKEAISCTGVENIVFEKIAANIFSRESLEELKKINMPITKFNALVRLLKETIRQYGHNNKIKALEFEERLKAVVEKYNNRDDLVFTSTVIDNLSDELIKIMQDLEDDKNSFEQIGISYEEKAFYDILVRVRDEHKFEYDDSKCISLAQEIKKIIDNNTQYADWAIRDDIKSIMKRELVKLLYKNGYPPTWNNDVFEKVLAQAENFKKYCA